MVGLCEGGNEPPSSLKANKSTEKLDTDASRNWSVSRNRLSLAWEDCTFNTQLTTGDNTLSEGDMEKFLVKLQHVAKLCGCHDVNSPAPWRRRLRHPAWDSRWFESSWGKKFSHEISASVCDRCPPSIMMHLGSYDR
ncbi:hypothetical protein ANN_23596 [Periplaneta americana]|uniref:Uncharacterized protein n=1 Tax=Periplaneta americana TaxID=6978 RepID=A0ABQ8SLZ6_PERAM|nr:hypothetical protein ANN_23596 [Periplaneta americana]